MKLNTQSHVDTLHHRKEDEEVAGVLPPSTSHFPQEHQPLPPRLRPCRVEADRNRRDAAHAHLIAERQRPLPLIRPFRNWRWLR